MTCGAFVLLRLILIIVNKVNLYWPLSGADRDRQFFARRRRDRRKRERNDGDERRESEKHL